MKLLRATLILLACVIPFACGASPAEASLEAGAAKIVITPDNPCYLGGYYHINTRTKGVHDDIHARVLALKNGDDTIVMIGMDIVIMGGVFAREIKKMIKKELGIPTKNVSITATHTHTGPEGYYEEFGKYPKEYDPDMKVTMQKRVVEAVVKAVGSMVPATATTVSLDLGDYFHNRHNSSGPVDPTAILLVVRDEATGKPMTGFLNMPAHATSSPAEKLLVSAGWPGRFTAAMEKKIGEGSTFLFLQGAAGNISPSGTGGGDGPWDGIEIYGNKLAAEVWQSVESSGPGTSDFVIGAQVKKMIVPARRKKSASAFARSINVRVAMIAGLDLSEAEKDKRKGWLEERRGIENFMAPMMKTMKRNRDHKTRTMVQAMRLGDTLLIAFPGEALSEVSILMRKQLAPYKTAVLGYTNDHLGYLSTFEVYEEGGYEAGMGLVYPESTVQFMREVKQLALELAAK